MGSLGPLPDGGRVVIAGGGPGGVACALALRHLARQAGRQVNVTLLEGKEFAGERHHNLSVGVLCPPLPALMQEYLGIGFPVHLARLEVAGYVLHSARDRVVLTDRHERGVAVRRVQFDDYMLETARRHEVEVISARVVDLDFHAGGVVVYTETVPLQADVVVGAFGMDEGAASIFARNTGYRPPHALVSVLTKYHPGPQSMAEFGEYVHAFLPGFGGIEFGAITPKGNHITINVAGRSVGALSLHQFLARPEVQSVLPCFERAGHFDHYDLRFFKGRFPNSLAARYYGDRYVMVGDAAGLVRAFKGKGVTTAVQTGIRAAQTILRTGISKEAFAADFAVANRDITDDLRYGQFMRLLVGQSVRLGLLDAVVRAAKGNATVREALFGAVSAHAPYRDVLFSMLDPQAIAAVLRAIAVGHRT